MWHAAVDAGGRKSVASGWGHDLKIHSPISKIWHAAVDAVRRKSVASGWGHDFENTQPREKSYVT